MEYEPTPERLKKGVHPATHVEGECTYCKPIEPASVALLTLWERTVRERPEVARTMGPPNWLVAERKKPGEEFKDAAARLRREYGLDVSDKPAMSDTEMSDKPQTSDNLSDKCEGCGKAWTGRGEWCWACQKRKQRDG